MLKRWAQRAAIDPPVPFLKALSAWLEQAASTFARWHSVQLSFESKSAPGRSRICIVHLCTSPLEAAANTGAGRCAQLRQRCVDRLLDQDSNLDISG